MSAPEAPSNRAARAASPGTPPAETPRARLRFTSGHLLAMLMVATGLAAAVTGLVFYTKTQRRPTEYWGWQKSLAVLSAGQLDLFALADAGPVEREKGDGPLFPPREADTAEEAMPAEDVGVDSRLRIGNRWYRVTSVRDVSKTPGFSHLHSALVNDNAFDWRLPIANDAPRWKYAVRFRGAQQTCWAAFDFDARAIAPIGYGAPVAIDRTLSDGLADLFDRNRPE